MKHLRTLIAVGLISAAATLPATAIDISGAGATFPYPIYAKWADAYKKQTNVGLNYQSIGSGGGIKQITNKTVTFGASDAPLKGVELDSNFVFNENFSGHLSSTWTDGKYVSYADGPCPLELIAATTTVCDLSGKPLSGLPSWVLSVGGEYAHRANIGALEGEAYIHAEAYARTKIYGDPSDSKYTVIDGYTIVNLSVGFRQEGPWEAFVWVKNLFDVNYIQNVTVQAGNSGLVVGTPSDPRTVGVTLRARF